MPTLHWLTREADLRRARAAPYRLLEPVPELSYGDPEAGNLLIQGDNLDTAINTRESHERHRVFPGEQVRIAGRIGDKGHGWD